MRAPPGTTITRNVQQAPSDPIAHHLSALALANTASPSANTAGGGPRRTTPSNDHREERGRNRRPPSIRTRRRALDAPAGALRTLVPRPRDAPRRASGRNTMTKRRVITPPPPNRNRRRARRWRRTRPGESRAAAAAERTARGEATSARSARLKRHFAANSRRRAARKARMDATPAVLERVERGQSRELAAAHREAQAVPVIGSTKPDASPARSSPSIDASLRPRPAVRARLAPPESARAEIDRPAARRRQRAAQRRRGIAKGVSPSAGTVSRGRHSSVHCPSEHADVASPPDVHFTSDDRRSACATPSTPSR